MATPTIVSYITLRLTPENYPIWKDQVLLQAALYDCSGLLTGVDKPPSMYLEVSDSQSTTVNPDYAKWLKRDLQMRGWIMATLSEESLGLIVGLDSSYKMWTALQDAYAQAFNKNFTT